MSICRFPFLFIPRQIPFYKSPTEVKNTPIWYSFCCRGWIYGKALIRFIAPQMSPNLETYVKWGLSNNTTFIMPLIIQLGFSVPLLAFLQPTYKDQWKRWKWKRWKGMKYLNMPTVSVRRKEDNLKGMLSISYGISFQRYKKV